MLLLPLLLDLLLLPMLLLLLLHLLSLPGHLEAHPSKAQGL